MPLSPHAIDALCQRLMAEPALLESAASGPRRLEVRRSLYDSLAPFSGCAVRGSSLRDETTVTIITCRNTRKISHHGDVLASVMRAITARVKNTAEAERAWDCSGDDFNVGNLASYCDRDTLRHI